MTLLEFANMDISVGKRASETMKSFQLELCAWRKDDIHSEVVMASDFNQEDHHCYAAGFMLLEDVLADDWELGFVAKGWNFVRDVTRCNEYNGVMPPYIMHIRDKSSVVRVTCPKKNPLRCDVTFCSLDAPVTFYIPRYPNSGCKIPKCPRAVTEYDIRIINNKISVQTHKHEPVSTTLVDFLGIAKDSGWFYY